MGWGGGVERPRQRARARAAKWYHRRCCERTWSGPRSFRDFSYVLCVVGWLLRAAQNWVDLLQNYRVLHA